MKPNEYFAAKEIAPRTWQISHAFTTKAHVYSYLIEGDDYALAIDTMYGYGDLKAFMQTLTDKPIKLAVTHAHPDHTGGCFHFDECYIHPADLPYFYNAQPNTAEAVCDRARDIALPEYKSKIDVADFVGEHAVRTLPIWDGDIFDLGGRQIEVIELGGHTPGSVVFLDIEARILYSGDACNSNTLMAFDNSLTVEEYMYNLLNFKHYQADFDVMYGGHEVLPPETVDEAIELCSRIIAGTDDKAVYDTFIGRPATYGAKRVENGFKRADGKNFNICYRPDGILMGVDTPRVIRR